MTESRPRTTVALGTFIRFAAEGISAVCALVTGAIVARQLGPDGKGVTSAIGYLVAIVGLLSGLGLGEAGVRAVQTGKTTLARAVGASLLPLAIASTIGAIIFVGLAAAVFGPVFAGLTGSVAVAALTVPAFALWQTMTLFTESQGRLISAAMARLSVAVVTMAASAVLILHFHRGVAGAVLGAALGYASAAVALLALAWRLGAPPRPLVDPGYVADALRFGVPVQLASFLVGLSARADVLVVQALRNGAEAGLYSVALTMSQLVMFAPVAMASATFGRIAALGEDAPSYIRRSCRASAAIALTGAGAVGLALPLLVPAAFGPGFQESVRTAWFLLPAGVLYTQQWVVCRCWAAIGRSREVLRSFLISTLVMVAGDFALVPTFGRTGAALAATVSSLLGLTYAARAGRAIDPRLDLAALVVPDWSALLEVGARARRSLTQGRGGLKWH